MTPSLRNGRKVVAAKCRDISELIAELGMERPVNPIRWKVAYHDSCHLQHAQGIRAQPRQLLSAISGIELIELPEAAICCGSAGVFNLIEPETARQLADRKARSIINSGAQALVSANPGCLLQIAGALKRAGHPLPVVHLIEVIDAALDRNHRLLRRGFAERNSRDGKQPR